MSEVKALKITNANWLGLIAPDIERFYKRLKIHGMSYETVYAYIAQIVQFGGDARELWIAFEDEKPAGFAVWEVLGLPHVAKVYCYAIHVWSKNPDVFDTLIKGFIAFGKRFRARWWSADLTNKALLRLYKSRAAKFGLEIIPSETISVIMREVTKENKQEKT